MKRTKRSKLLTVLLAIAMVMIFSMVVFAEDSGSESTDVMSGTCGATEHDNVTWELEQNNENDQNPTYTLIISGNGVMEDYANATKVPWNAYLNNQITVGIVEEGVTHLGARAFVMAKNLESVTLPQSLESIGMSTFNQSSLTSISFPAGLKEIGSYAFYQSALAGELNIPSNVTTIREHAFNQSQITDVTLPSGLTFLGGGAFNGTQLTSMPEIPLGITTLSTVFQNCTDITAIAIPSHVTSLDRTFMGCTGLTTVTIPETVESYVGVFNGCTGLTNAVIESKADNIGGSNTNNATGVFGGCTNLKTVSVPEWIKEIGMSAFRNCSSLETTDFIERATIIKSYAFQGCTSLKGSLNLSASKIEALAFDKCSNLGNNISVANTVFMGDSAFRDCNGINGIVYAQGVSNGANKFNSKSVTALLNGGTFSADTDLYINTLAIPAKEGYIFDGWYDNESFTGESAIVPESGKTYYAKWIEMKPGNDKEDLLALIKYAQDAKNAENYKYVVPKVKALFEKALENAIAVYAKEDATQAEVDAAYEALLAKVHLLDFTGNTESLTVLVGTASGKVEAMYTKESWAPFAEALEAAREVLADENALQAEIDTAREVLQAAMDALVENPIDTSKLEKLVADASVYEENLENYIPSTAESLMAALDGAREVLASSEITQDAVDSAYATLLNAIFGLREVPNKDRLEGLLGQVKALDLSTYSEESANAVKAAVAMAAAVMEDENANQKQVDAAVAALEEAVAGLEAKEEPGADDTNTDNTESGDIEDGSKKDDSSVTDQKVASNDAENKDTANKTTSDKTGGKAAAQTGDAAKAAVPAVAAVAALLAVWFVWKKK